MDLIKVFGGGFPLTIERLEFLQETYGKAFKQLTSVLGDGNYFVLDGVDKVNLGGVDSLTDGVVVINGEVLPFSGGAYNDTIIVRSTSIQVPYNEDADNDGNLDQKFADTVRVAMPKGVLTQADDEPSPFSSFVKLPKLEDLLPKIGDVKIISRDFNPAIDKGYELLDMGDRFPIGAGASHSVGATGGANTATISIANMPPHNHNASFSIPPHTHSLQGKTAITFNGEGGDGNRLTNKDNIGSGTVSQTSPNSSQTVNFNTGSKGNGTPLTIKPSFRAFNFLIFVGF